MTDELESNYTWIGRVELYNVGVTISTPQQGGNQVSGDLAAWGGTNSESSVTYFPYRYNLNHTHTLSSTDSETRPINIAYTIWRRTA